MSRLAAVVLACVVCVSACGVSSEDEPQLIEESTEQRPAATPSFDAETSPTTGSPELTTPTASPSSVRPSPSG